jgi:hypothetical protein
VYDMYAWDQSAREADRAQEAAAAPETIPAAEPSDRSQTRPATEVPDAVHAVQIALDRRDNGGPATATVATSAR